MLKTKQFKLAMSKQGIEIDNFAQGKELSSNILKHINAGMQPTQMCHSKDGNHNRQHSKTEGLGGGTWGGAHARAGGGHSKCTHQV